MSGRHPLEGSSDPMPAQEGSASCSQHSAGCCCEPDLSAGVPEPSCMPEAGGTAQEAAQGRPGRRRDRTCTERGGRLHAIALLLCLTLADRPCLGGTGPVCALSSPHSLAQTCPQAPACRARALHCAPSVDIVCLGGACMHDLAVCCGCRQQGLSGRTAVLLETPAQPLLCRPADKAQPLGPG